MSIAEYQNVTVSNFAGPWTRPEPTDVPVTQSLLALNSEFQPGNVGTRKGFGLAFNPNEAISSMANWLSSLGNYLTYYNPSTGNIQLRDLAGGSTITLYTQSGGAGAIIAPNGTRMVSATFDSDGSGLGQCRITGKYGAAFQTDRAFLGPLSIKPTLANSGTGNVTAGLKRVGYIIQTRNGFLGRISPVSVTSNQFDITSTITATGGQQITFSLTTTWPVEADRIWFVMTTSDNLDRYFIIPNAPEIHVPGGSSFTVNATLDISDGDLASTGTDVTSNNLLFTQNFLGQGPFEPLHVGIFGSRTTYLTEIDGQSQGYASEPDNAQSITADQHVFYLPGFQQMRSQGAIGNILYVLGPNWTYAFEDTGDVPVTWPSPRLVDGFIGTSAPRGFTLNASTGIGWTAHTTGLYVFQGGAYSPLPVSYMVNPDWQRINWNAAATIQVVDDKDKQRVCVIAPLDGSGAPSNVLVFDYTDGMTAETIKYSLWYIAGYFPGAGCIVQNPTSGLLEFWVANSSAGAVLRQKNAKDTNVYNDNGGPIDWQFETAYLPGLGVDMGRVWYHYAAQIRAVGNGPMNMLVLAMDHHGGVTAQPITLSAQPGQVYTRRYPRVRSESISYRFTNGNVADQYAILSAVAHFYAPGPSYRN